MNSNLKKIILTLFTGLFFLQAGIYAQVKPSETESGKPGKVEKTEKTEKKNPGGLANVTLEDLAVNFPEVENWEQSEIQKYPTEDLGFSINYESETGGRVTIYVYKGGEKSIPDGVMDKVIKNQLNKAKDEIKQVAEMGYYENLKELKNDTVTLGGSEGKTKALHTLYTFTARQQNVTSEIYIFGNKNRFIKIRATRPRDNNENGDKMVVDLLKEIDTFFSN